MSRYLKLFVIALLLMWIGIASAQVVEVPDANLRDAIRETLALPAAAPLTQQEMVRLKVLYAEDRDIADLTGLDYATNLIHLDLSACGIVDIAPLADLTRLQKLHLSTNKIVDIAPLANLTQLEFLNLNYNYPLTDINPLANLIKLEILKLNGNLIQDITPLSNLTNLRHLEIVENPILDYSPVEALSLTVFLRSESCELPFLSIEDRLKNRTFPSIFAAFGKPTDMHTQISGLNHLSPIEQLALHDLTWRDPYLGFGFFDTHEGWRLTGIVEEAQEIREELLNHNPNMLLLVDIRVRDAWIGYYPEDFPYWIRDANGSPITEPLGLYLLTDFTQPGMQDIIVEQAVAVAKCGLFDGIFFDWFAEEGGAVLVGTDPSSWEDGYVGYEAEQQAKDTILRRIRAAVRDDFLIMVNTGRHKIPRRAWGINGVFLETLQDTRKGLPVVEGDPYGYDGLKYIEETLRWAEGNLREPQVNCLQGWGTPNEPPDSPRNKRFMRVFTTMSLTHTDGYVLYGMDNSHQHIWHDFWDADLGRPVGAKSQLYKSIDGLFIREFTNGWAVYNRSGEPQAISLPQVSSGVSSSKKDIIHLLPDLDGEIYLRVGVPIDLNADGTVNILDLILVSQNFGTAKGDINGDGETNVLDLTLVAAQFK